MTEHSAVHPVPFRLTLPCATLLLLLGCSVKSPSFTGTGQHPQILESDFASLQMEILTSDSPGGEIAAWRARVVGYDGAELVAASIVGPYFDAEESPSQIRPIFLSDGYLQTRARYLIDLPAEGASLYVRLFRVVTEESWFSESKQLADEFMAVHLRLNSQHFMKDGNPEKPYCEASFWRIRNPVRSIVHCYLPSPRELQKLTLEIAVESGEPRIRIPEMDLLVEE